MNKKLLVIPTIVLSSALLLTGCTGGKSATPDKVPTNQQTASSSASGNAGYVAPPKDLSSNYKGYYYSPTTVVPDAWEYYKSTGATTYKEDPSLRTTSGKDWDEARGDNKNFQKFDKLYGEVMSDVEQSALNISTYLENHKSASTDEIKNTKDLVINRYPNLGNTKVEKDESTGFYFVIFTVKDGSAKDASAYGILVPQKGITPDFNQPNTSK